MNHKSIGFELGKINHLIAQCMQLNAKKEGCNPSSAAQAKVIHYLYENKDKTIYQTDIESFLGVRRSTVTGILQTMENKHIIKRTSSKEDARKKVIELYEEVERKVEMSINQIKEIEKAMQTGFTENELKELKRFLERIENNLLERRNQYEK